MTIWQRFDPSLTWHDANETDVVVLLSLWMGPDQVRSALAGGVSARMAKLGFGNNVHLLWFSRPAQQPTPHCFILFATGEPEAGDPLPSWIIQPLDGTGAPVHTLSQQLPLVLSTAEEEPFLRFFVFALKGPDAPFVIVESVDQLDLAIRPDLIAPLHRMERGEDAPLP